MAKYQLPEVFQEIIKVDLFIHDIIKEPAVNFEAYTKAKEYKKRLRIGAQNLVKRQRGSGGGAGNG